MNVDSAVAVLTAFQELYDFGRELGPVPDLVRFWRDTFARERRLLLCGPVGARVEAVFEALAGPPLGEDRLRRRICEARPDAGGLPGIDALTGSPFAGALVSAALHGTAGPAPDSLPLADWLERVALIAIVSPAPAVLGKLETGLMERLAGEGRGFCLVVTRLEGADETERAEFRAEIEEHKVRPLRGERGSFEVFYTVVGDPDLRAGLGAWVRSRLAEAHLQQLHRVVARWAAELKEGLEIRAAGERKVEARLAFLSGHLEDQVERLRDLVSQERMTVENRVQEAVKALEKDCEEGGPFVRTAWKEFAVCLAAAPAELAERVRERFAGQIREFGEAYRDLVPPFEFDARAEFAEGEKGVPPPFPGAADLREVERRARAEAQARLGELADEDGRRLADEAEAVLVNLDRHVRSHVLEKQASLRAAGLLSRLEGLAAALHSPSVP